MITKELYEQGIGCRGICEWCKDIHECYQGQMWLKENEDYYNRPIPKSKEILSKLTKDLELELSEYGENKNMNYFERLGKRELELKLYGISLASQYC